MSTAQRSSFLFTWYLLASYTGSSWLQYPLHSLLFVCLPRRTPRTVLLFFNFPPYNPSADYYSTIYITYYNVYGRLQIPPSSIFNYFLVSTECLLKLPRIILVGPIEEYTVHRSSNGRIHGIRFERKHLLPIIRTLTFY